MCQKRLWWEDKYMHKQKSYFLMFINTMLNRYISQIKDKYTAKYNYFKTFDKKIIKMNDSELKHIPIVQYFRTHQLNKKKILIIFMKYIIN